MDDWQCLAEFVESGSQKAFSRLVSRHVNLVYSAALRQVKDRDLAEDITQSTFIVLARKARRLRRGASLAAWLLVTTRFLAMDALTKKSRRDHHERKAAFMGKPQTASDDRHWESISPHLDAALASLSGRDREAITLRFFEDKSFREVADAMGVSVVAARQCVRRATERMRAYFALRGATLSAEAIGPMILARAVQTAPPRLVTTTSAAATTHVVGASGSLVGKGAILLMTLSKAKLMVAGTVILIVSGGAVVAYKAVAPAAPESVVMAGRPHVDPSVSPDWETRLNEVYALADGQDVKQVEPPMIPERERYWEKAQNGNKLFPSAILTFDWDGKQLGWKTVSAGDGRLANVVQSAAGLHLWEFDSSVPLGLPLPGDWVIRHGVSSDRIMQGLGAIVSKKLGRPVRFERRHVMREAVVVRGTYRFVPLAGHPNDGVIEILGDEPPQNQKLTPSLQTMPLRRCLERLDVYANRKIVVETESAGLRVTIRDRPTWGDGSAVLRNIAAQTSLQFSPEPREMDLWFMTDATAAPAAQREPE